MQWGVEEPFPDLRFTWGLGKGLFYHNLGSQFFISDWGRNLEHLAISHPQTRAEREWILFVYLSTCLQSPFLHLHSPGQKPREWYNPQWAGFPTWINIIMTISYRHTTGQPDLETLLWRLSSLATAGCTKLTRKVNHCHFMVDRIQDAFPFEIHFLIFNLHSPLLYTVEPTEQGINSSAATETGVNKDFGLCLKGYMAPPLGTLI